MTHSVYLRPIALGDGGELPATAMPLAGGPLHFASAELVLRCGFTETERLSVPPAEAFVRIEQEAGLEAAVALQQRLTERRPPFAGMSLDRTRIMGVINVTPDSFSDGGDRFDHGRAVADGLAVWQAGADILDIGGESTRPGAEAVTVEEELRRVIPVVTELARQGALVSIDSRNAKVMAAAIDAGAGIINDVTALGGDPESLDVASQSDCGVVLMHMQGLPETMQKAPSYTDVVLDIFDYLQHRLRACLEAGITMDRVAIDPGIGFGKRLEHNLAILDQLALYHGLGAALLLGVSRKSFIGHISGGVAPKARLPGSLAAALAGCARGVQILRVHDVAETRQALDVWEAIGRPREGPALAAE